MNNQVQAWIALLFGSGGLIAVGYLLWRVQHSMINPMDKRITSLEKSDLYQRQERAVCEWRQRKLVRWLRKQEAITPPDWDIDHERPAWAILKDPIDEEVVL